MFVKHSFLNWWRFGGKIVGTTSGLLILCSHKFSMMIRIRTRKGEK